MARKYTGLEVRARPVSRSTFARNPHAFVSRGILVVLFNSNVETARARDAHLRLRVLISNPDRAKANGTLAGFLLSCLVFHTGSARGSTKRARDASARGGRRTAKEKRRGNESESIWAKEKETRRGW